MKKGVLYSYRDFLPLTSKTPMFTLGEGDTPLVRSQWIEKKVGCAELYFKLEGCNPTGSFKDRGMVVAVAKAAEAGSKVIMCASTGNTSASAAAYGARFGLNTVVIVPGGKIAKGKLAQAIVYGAKIIVINGNFDHALTLARQITDKHPVTLVNSVNPFRIEGQKTASFEIIDNLGEAPDYLFLPVGNAGNITAYWKGFVEYHKLGRAHQKPKMMGFQAAGAAPIVLGRVVPEPQTIATAIRIGNPASWQSAEKARDESKGVIDSVTDEEILKAYNLLGNKEGVFGEPASAAGVAGLIKLVEGGLNVSGKRIVCIITGSGLKDPDTALSCAGTFPEITADLATLEQMLGFKYC
jgi:threonine synthase